jgi:hypothetical protein
LVLPEEYHQGRLINLMEITGLSRLKNLRTVRWAGLQSCSPYLIALREICRENKDHLKSLELDFYSWPRVNFIWYRDAMRLNDSTNPNFLVSGLLSEMDVLTALENLSLREFLSDNGQWPTQST